jgi:signal transduction histidine kinase
VANDGLEGIMPPKIQFDKIVRERRQQGLGLSISEWIARQHHADIEVESEEVGSVFRVFLPDPP